jgi:hypothetical protein
VWSRETLSCGARAPSRERRAEHGAAFAPKRVSAAPRFVQFEELLNWHLDQAQCRLRQPRRDLENRWTPARRGAHLRLPDGRPTANPDETTVDRLPTGALTGADLAKLWSALTSLDSDEEPDAWEVCEEITLGSLSPQRGLEMRPGGWTIDLAKHDGPSGRGRRDDRRSHELCGHGPASGLHPSRRTSAAVRHRAGTPRPTGTKASPRAAPQYDSRVDGLTVISTDAVRTSLDKVRSQVSETDSEEFVERMLAVGEVDDAGYGEVRLRPPGRPC